MLKKKKIVVFYDLLSFYVLMNYFDLINFCVFFNTNMSKSHARVRRMREVELSVLHVSFIYSSWNLSLSHQHNKHHI